MFQQNLDDMQILVTVLYVSNKIYNHQEMDYCSILLEFLLDTQFYQI